VARFLFASIKRKEGGHDVTEQRRQRGELTTNFVLEEAEQHCCSPPFSLGARAARTMKQASVLSTNHGGGEEAACDLSRARAHRPAGGEWMALILPEIFEPTGRQSRILNRGHDRR
jgi:hypothetical protein